jgi:hypothetical protein
LFRSLDAIVLEYGDFEEQLQQDERNSSTCDSNKIFSSPFFPLTKCPEALDGSNSHASDATCVASFSRFNWIIHRATICLLLHKLVLSSALLSGETNEKVSQLRLRTVEHKMVRNSHSRSFLGISL